MILAFVFILLISIFCANAVPAWSNNQVNIVANYSPTTASYFNITWQTADNISTVWFESDYSGNSQNYSMNLISGNITNGVYNYSTILPAGTFNWKSYANDSLNNWSSSDSWQFTINKASSTCLLSFDPASGQAYPTAVNASCSCTNPEGTAKLYRGGADVTATENNQLVNLSAGTCSYVCNVSATENYTAANDTADYEITKAATTLTLDADDWSVDEETQTTVNCTADNDEVNVTLYLDGDAVANPHTTTLDAGTYTYTCNTTGSDNYSNSSTEHDIEIEETSSGGSSGGGAIPSSITWDTSLKKSTTLKLRTIDTVELEIGGDAHKAKIIRIGDNHIDMKISSDPIEFRLYLNHSKKIDIENDGVYDLLLTLEKIEYAKAEITFETISEEVIETEDNITVETEEEVIELISPETEQEPAITPQTEPNQTTTSLETKEKSYWMWWVIAAMIIIAIMLIIGIKKKRQ